MRVCTQCKSLLKPDASKCPSDGANVDEVDELPKDTRLGQYKIDRMLGEGGMGFVYEATHEVLNRRTAIKLLRPEFATHANVVTRFLNEAKAVNLIDHQNIINVYDYGDGADGSVYFVMEFLEGETLDDLMRKRRPMQMPLLLHVFSQVAKALAAAHAKKIVHRDLKPANVYVVAREDNPYFIKLLDFGIAQLRGEGEVKGLTVAGSIMGTPQYMSPEQISGGAVDARSDVWALGVMLYRAASGQAPFKGEGFAELAGKILHESPKPLGDLVQVPAALAKLVSSCLERDVNSRCASISDVIAGLEKVKKELKLDDDAILTAVRADSGAISEAMPVNVNSEPSRLGASLPQYQGALAPSKPVEAKKSRTPMFVAAGVAGAGIAIALYFAFGRGGTPTPETKPPVAPSGSAPEPGSAAPATPSATIAAKLAAGDRPGARALAEQALRDALGSGKPQQQGFAVDALGMVRTQAGLPLLYIALKAPPDVRVKAARALAELAIPDSAPKVRAALAESGDKVKVELAAVLFRLGDKDARAILKRATEDPGMRLVAALALVETGDDAGKPALAEIVESTPVGREQWRRAAAGLAKLGDAKARAALVAELTQPDAARAVAAAELLARGGDDRGRDYLARVVADTEFARPGDAAFALARLGDKRGLAWTATGFASTDVDERKQAIAVAGMLGAAGDNATTLAKLATDDPDVSTRMTAQAALLGL